MSKKNVEESTVNDFQIDDQEVETFERVEVETNVVNINKKNLESKKAATGEELVSCLRNEKIIVSYIMKATSISNQKHVLFGGMAENASKVLTVPQLASGQLKNVLTNDEKKFLEVVMGLEENALSIYNKEKNFWKNYQVRLGKSDTYLDLSIPDDFIKYKVLLANSILVAPSLEALSNFPKETYIYVLKSQEEEIKLNNENMTASMEASMLVGTIMENKDKLRAVAELVSGKKLARTTKMDYIKAEVFKQMSANPKLIIQIIKDKFFETKILIMNCIDYGVIRKRGDYYYVSADNTPLCEANEDPNLHTACIYLNSPKRQTVKLLLEAKYKQLSD